MRRPYFSKTSCAISQSVRFQGYNKSGEYENAVVDMGNMCFDNYPSIKTVNRRRIAKTLSKPNGIFSHNKLYWVDGDTLYCQGEAVCRVQDNIKEFCKMGAYLVIMPDGIVVNTLDNTYGYMDTIHDVLSATVHFCDRQGADRDTAEGFLKIYLAPAFVSVDDFIEIYDCDQKLAGWHRVYATSDESAEFLVVDYSEDTLPTTAMKIRRGFPQNDCMVSVNNRLWCADSENHEIYASILGSPFCWHRYEGISTDSYAATVGSSGQFTAAATLYSYAYFFKEGCVHKVYGDTPQDFVITEEVIKGVKADSKRSVAYVNGGIAYLSTDGFYFFSGSEAVCISQALKGCVFYNAVGGAIGDKYYVSCFEKTSATTGQSVLLCYDFSNNLWAKLDNSRIEMFCAHDNLLYALASDGTLYCFDDEGAFGIGDSVFEDEKEFFCTVKTLCFDSYLAKYLQRVIVDIKCSGSAMVSVSFDGETFFNAYELCSGVRHRLSIPCHAVRGSFVWIKIEGVGETEIFSITKLYEKGGNF